ncbi:hypothetical protein HK104_004625, partial [Borealophlyctis nickersoniae]
MSYSPEPPPEGFLDAGRRAQAVADGGHTREGSVGTIHSTDLDVTVTGRLLNRATHNLLKLEELVLSSVDDIHEQNESEEGTAEDEEEEGDEAVDGRVHPPKPADLEVGYKSILSLYEDSNAAKPVPPSILK